MWAKYMNLVSSFAFCIVMAVFVFVFMLVDVYLGRTGWAIFNGIGTVAWLWLAHQATKKPEPERPLTVDEIEAHIEFLIAIKNSTVKLIEQKQDELHQLKQGATTETTNGTQSKSG